MNRVILIGDSIRMGYQQTVREELAGQAEVTGPDMNSYDSRNVLAKLQEWAIDPRPDLVHINCGLHDVKRDRTHGRFQVPLEDYAANVEQILQRLLAVRGPRVIWATITPVNEHWHGLLKPFDRFEADVQAYNARAMEICGRLGLPVDDLHSFLTRAGADRYLAQDGVHLSADGYELLGTQVARVIRDML